MPYKSADKGGTGCYRLWSLVPFAFIDIPSAFESREPVKVNGL